MSAATAIQTATYPPRTTPVQRQGWVTPVVFVVALLAVWLFAGNTAALVTDEGIYFEGARAAAEGQVLYRDHFAFTGPGTYWLVALCFKLFGYTVATGRIPLLIDIAITTTFVYWLAARHMSRRAAIYAAFLCFAIETANPSMQNTSHRWDSAALACLSIAFSCRRDRARWAPFLAGVFAAAAAWCSPPVLLLGGVLLAWHWKRMSVLPYLAGGAACSAASVAVLALTGSLPHLIPSLLWAGRNYSDANRVPYGFVVGGLTRVFAGGSIEFLVIGAIVFAALLAPTVFPIVHLLGTRQILRGHPELKLTTACSLALVASTYPRSDANHLTYVMAPGLFVCVWLASRWRLGPYIGGVLGLSAALLLYGNVTATVKATQRETRSGLVRGSASQLDAITALQTAIPAGATLFAYPYLPMMYFITGAVNPTPYSFLQPGMMTQADEADVLVRLKQNPPEYVVFDRVNAEDMLRIWPNSDVKRLHMPALEGWIESQYSTGGPGSIIGGHRLYRRK